MKLQANNDYGIIFNGGTVDVHATAEFDSVAGDEWIFGNIIGGDTGDYRPVQIAFRTVQMTIELEHGYMERMQVRAREAIAAQARNQNDLQDAIDQANGRSGPQLHVPRNEN